MRRRFRGSSRRKDRTGLKVGLAIGGVFVALVLILGGIVVSDNNALCNKIGLSGFIGESCYAKDGYSFQKIALVVGNTANTPVPTLNKESEKYLSASLINEDSDIKAYSVTPDKARLRIEKNISESDSLEKQVKAVSNTLDKIKNETIVKEPTSDGAMYLETITRAARTMSASKDEEGAIIVIGSGLSDNGLLNFADQNLLNRSVDEIINTITKDGEEAIVEDSLKNITIYWSGIGEVASPQGDLTDTEIEKLKEIYERVFEYMGAKKVILESGTTENDSIKTNYTVKNVGTDGWDKIWSGDGQILGENSSLAFIGNKASLKDETAAKNELSALAEGLRKHSNAKVIIEGYVARGGCNAEPDNNLASARAETVKNLLISMGVSSNQISASGQGWGGNNECPNGRWDESVASSNRIVKIRTE